MNVAHIFSEEAKESLAKFIKASNSCDYHDFKPKEKEYKMWSQFMKGYDEIDLTDVEPQSSAMSLFEGDNFSTKKEYSNSSDIEDSKTLAISMPTDNINLIGDELVCEYLVMDIKNEPVEKIEEIYRQYLPRFDFLRLIEMGRMIMSTDPYDSIVECYCKELLFQMMSQMFKDNLKTFFYEFYAHYKSLVTKRIINFFEVHNELKTFLLYINSTSSKESELSLSLFREFLVSYEGPLTKKHMIILDHLTGENTDYSLNKMVIDILSSNAVEYKEDKDYGRLLVKITENLGPEVDSLKNQINSILGIHSSIWKMKLKKIISKYSDNI